MTIRQRFMKVPQVVAGEKARFTTKIEKYFSLTSIGQKNRGFYRKLIKIAKEKAAFSDLKATNTNKRIKSK